MTDEQKAEDYVKINHSHIMSGTMKSIYKKIYLDGLAEGRKELAELKEKLNAWEHGNPIRELEKTVEELQLNLRSKNDLVEELTIQIEKMKCCGNCNKATKCSKWVKQHMQGNKITCCWGCVEWEVAE